MPPAPASTSDRLLLLGQAIGRVRAALAPAMPALISEVASDLERSAADVAEERDRRTLIAAGAMLRMESRRREELAYSALEERAHRCLETVQQSGDEARAIESLDAIDGLDRRLATELGQAVRDYAAAEYADYAMRVASLMPGLWKSDELNPLGARTVAAAVLECFRGLGDVPAMAAALRRALLARLPVAARAVVGEVRAWLESTVVADDEEDDLLGPGTLGAAATVIGAAASARALGISPFEAARAEPRLRLVPALRPIVELEGDGIAFARSVGVEPYGRQARAAFFGSVRERLAASGAAAAQCAVVDVVAAMFDYIADDRRLPANARSLLWRLQLPTVALALMDPNYIGDGPRTLRGLIEALGAVSAAHPGALTPGDGLYLRLEEIVQAVEVVADTLQTRLSAIARQVDHEYARAAAGVALLAERIEGERGPRGAEGDRRNRRDYRTRPGAEQERAVTERITAMLGERLDRNPVPDSVREFLSNVWLRRLRTAALRDGEDSDGFRSSLAVIDDLLWSLEPGHEHGARAELAQRIPRLVRLLTRGAQETGARDDEYKFFFDELFLMHLRRMQPHRDRDRSVSSSQA